MPRPPNYITTKQFNDYKKEINKVIRHLEKEITKFLKKQKNK